MSSIELLGWLHYLEIDDEVQTQRLALAIIRAFGGGKRSKRQVVEDEDEEIIDTTDPKFAASFKGFTNIPGAPQRAPNRQTNTQILMG